MIARCHPGCDFSAHGPCSPSRPQTPSASGQVDTGLDTYPSDLSESFPLCFPFCIATAICRRSLENPLLRPNPRAADAGKPSWEASGRSSDSSGPSLFFSLHFHGPWICVIPGLLSVSHATACVNGMFGVHCEEHCACRKGATCHHVTGACLCPPGWRGSHCEQGKQRQ